MTNKNFNNKKINNNGFNFVDLGLPTGTLWASCNVGASKPSDSGLYFQWGDTVGYTKEQVGKEKQFTESDYKWSIDGSYSNFSKYKTTSATLKLEDDAANANLGGDWHMPTLEQIEELIDNTKSAWTTSDGVSGVTFTSSNGKSIFIPASGHIEDGAIDRSGIAGSIWISKLSAISISNGLDLFFNSSSVSLVECFRSNGFPVRGVIG